jgi:hypothetical protein
MGGNTTIQNFLLVVMVATLHYQNAQSNIKTCKWCHCLSIRWTPMLQTLSKNLHNTLYPNGPAKRGSTCIKPHMTPSNLLTTPTIWWIDTLRMTLVVCPATRPAIKGRRLPQETPICLPKCHEPPICPLHAPGKSHSMSKRIVAFLQPHEPAKQVVVPL